LKSHHYILLECVVHQRAVKVTYTIYFISPQPITSNTYVLLAGQTFINKELLLV